MAAEAEAKARAARERHGALRKDTDPNSTGRHPEVRQRCGLTVGGLLMELPGKRVVAAMEMPAAAGAALVPCLFATPADTAADADAVADAAVAGEAEQPVRQRRRRRPRQQHSPVPPCVPATLQLHAPPPQQRAHAPAAAAKLRLRC